MAPPRKSPLEPPDLLFPLTPLSTASPLALPPSTPFAASISWPRSGSASLLRPKPFFHHRQLRLNDSPSLAETRVKSWSFEGKLFSWVLRTALTASGEDTTTWSMWPRWRSMTGTKLSDRSRRRRCGRQRKRDGYFLLWGAEMDLALPLFLLRSSSSFPTLGLVLICIFFLFGWEMKMRGKWRGGEGRMEENKCLLIVDRGKGGGDRPPELGLGVRFRVRI